MNSNGRTMKSGFVACASARYHENGRHDLLDCEWKENHGLREILAPLLGGDPKRIRDEVVKTNVAFRRSAKKADIDIVAAIGEAEPFLAEIIAHVKPVLILLTGVPILDFLKRHATRFEQIGRTQKARAINQVVFAAARARLRRTSRVTLVVQVAHASRFAWTYKRYNVAQRTFNLLETSTNAGAISK